jgi:hypothetical protein
MLRDTFACHVTIGHRRVTTARTFASADSRFPPLGIPDLELIVRRSDNLDEFVHRRKGSTKVSKATRAFCRTIFDQFDDNRNGEIQSKELVPLLAKLMRFMGIVVDDEVLARLELEAPQVLEVFDADGNGILDFDEFVAMISQEPWSHILPANSDEQTDAARSLGRFCSLSAVLIDGDPNMVPWFSECSELCHLGGAPHTACTAPGRPRLSASPIVCTPHTRCLPLTLGRCVKSSASPLQPEVARPYRPDCALRYPPDPLSPRFDVDGPHLNPDSR